MSLNGLDRNKVDGIASPAQSFNRSLDFYTVTTSGAGGNGNNTWRSDLGAGGSGLDDAGDPNNLEQYLFDKMVEIISQTAQPIILTGGGTGSNVFSFVVEHPAVWIESDLATTGESLSTQLQTAIRALTDDADAVLYASDFAAAVASNVVMGVVV
jgi:hypothetical protein